MDSVLMIGYGNRLRSDDGLGVRAAEELSRSIPAGTQIFACHQLTPELAERISHVDVVLFIDASRTGPPGEILCTQVEPRPANSLFAHQLTPETLLSLCSELYAECPQAFEITLRGECFDLGDQLSPEVAAMLPHLVEFARGFSQRLPTGAAAPTQATCRSSW